MPVRFRVIFRVSVPEELRENPAGLRIYPDQLHGFFMNLLPESLRQEFHRPARVKPFSLWCEEIFRPSEIIERSALHLEISFLQNDYLAPFLYHLSVSRDFPSLGKLGVLQQEFKSSLLRSVSYLAYGPPQECPFDYLSFHFITPVSFRRGEHDYPLPDPTLLFKSLLMKWNYFSEVKAPSEELLRELSRGYIAYVRVNSHTVYLSTNGAVTGFTGRLIFGKGKISSEIWSWLSLLAEFSNYSGAGRKTTMGLGKTSARGKKKPSPEDEDAGDKQIHS